MQCGERGGVLSVQQSKHSKAPLNFLPLNNPLLKYCVIFIFCHVKGHFHVENMIHMYNPPKRNKNRRRNTQNKDGEEFDTCQICHEIIHVMALQIPALKKQLWIYWHFIDF